MWAQLLNTYIGFRDVSVLCPLAQSTTWPTFSRYISHVQTHEQGHTVDSGTF